MPITNIKFIDYSDSQNFAIDKINHNFDEIVEFHGGSVGETGPTGDRGSIGLNGPIGPTGNSGQRGTKWFVQSSAPSGNAGVSYGDYWVDSGDSSIKLFSDSGWSNSGYSLSSDGNIFNDIQTYFTSGGTGISVKMDQIDPDKYTFVVSDKSPQSGIINQKLAKLLISTDPSRNPSPLLEFMKSDLISSGAGVYALQPTISWYSRVLSDNSLKFDIPGGSFLIGASGGFNSYSQSINVSAGTSVDITYGVTSGSGISATGGISLLSQNGALIISSDNLDIGSNATHFKSNVGVGGNSANNNPSVSMDIGGTGGFKTERRADSFNSLSNSVYNVSLETLSDREFYINTKGKIRTKKIRSGVTYQSYQDPVGVFSTGGSTIEWYFVSRPGGPVQSTPIKNGNTAIITPRDPGATRYVGIGLYNDPLYSLWGPTGGIDSGQSMDINVYCSPDSSSYGVSTRSLFKYIGVGTTSGVVSVVTLPEPAISVDFTIAKGVPTGASTVYYKAYMISGGTGGSFQV
jgi:hypothetical protein